MRPTVQILSGIWLQASDGTLELAATDMELSLRSSLDAEIAEPGTVVLPGRLLVDIAKLLPASEVEIAHSFQQAAKSYQENPTALHLRAMNMLYEGLKEKGALMLVPSSAVESMGMGGLLGAAALRQAHLTGSDSPGAPPVE